MAHQVKIFKPNGKGELKLIKIIPASVPSGGPEVLGWGRGQPGRPKKRLYEKSRRGGVAGAKAKNSKPPITVLRTSCFNGDNGEQ